MEDVKPDKSVDTRSGLGRLAVKRNNETHDLPCTHRVRRGILAATLPERGTCRNSESGAQGIRQRKRQAV